MLPQDDYFARLTIETNEMKREQPGFQPVNGNLNHWQGFILGTNLYDGGIFVFDIQLPREYPFKPPDTKLLTQVWHPNVFNERVCIGILGKDWAPTNNLVDIIESLRFLLSNPNPEDPLHSSAAKMMKDDYDAFKTKVSEWVNEYATWDQLEQYNL